LTNFSDLGLIQPLLDALSAEGLTTPTPIQEGAIPQLLAGRDLLGIAQTGTGKTAAFALPMLHRLFEEHKRPAPQHCRALILTPTRELAIQIGRNIQTYGRNTRLRHTVIFGGVGFGPQINALKRGIDIVVATPGRLLDLMNQGHLKLDHVSCFVLDEADRMLDMGFVRDVKKIADCVPRKRQTLLFSATMPQAVSGLAAGLLTNPGKVEIAAPATTVERIAQRVCFVDRNDKRDLLVDVLSGAERAIVFSRTKHGANRLADHLNAAGVKAEALHGNKSQAARQKALDSFRAGQVRALVATDIAARGIDVPGISHVVNFDLPDEPESYVHRIGRTARAGASGEAVAFCERDDLFALGVIEKTIRQPVPIDAEHAYHAQDLADVHAAGTARKPKKGPNGGRLSDSRGPGGGGARPQGGNRAPGTQNKPRHAQGAKPAHHAPANDRPAGNGGRKRRPPRGGGMRQAG
jgi:ATP-dependent RNA helicase RhlE